MTKICCLIHQHFHFNFEIELREQVMVITKNMTMMMMYTNRGRWLKPLDFCSGDTRFEFLLGRLPWLRSFVIFLSSLKQVLGREWALGEMDFSNVERS